jgi:REP element-mobilizing transposase RayT
MTRPIRLQFPGALYHVTSRGVRKALIYLDDTDRAVWLQTLADVCARYGFAVHAFCQMGNHYHLLLETADGNLAQGMRQLNGVYSQYFNRRHELAGHVFQGRYNAILVDKETYLVEVARYIVLNPVRARLVVHPQEWRWSSYRITMMEAPSPAWLDTGWLLSRFHEDALAAKAAYSQFIMAGIDAVSPLANTYHQLILGSEQFIRQLQTSESPSEVTGVSRIQRRTLVVPLHVYQQKYPNRDEAMAHAYRSNAYTLSEIARHFGVSLMTVSRAARKRS